MHIDLIDIALGILTFVLAVAIGGVLILAGHTQPQGCTFQLSNVTVTMHSGQLISNPNTQILCVNGQLNIETR